MKFYKFYACNNQKMCKKKFLPEVNHNKVVQAAKRQQAMALLRGPALHRQPEGEPQDNLPMILNCHHFTTTQDSINKIDYAISPIFQDHVKYNVQPIAIHMVCTKQEEDSFQCESAISITVCLRLIRSGCRLRRGAGFRNVRRRRDAPVFRTLLDQTAKIQHVTLSILNYFTLLSSVFS